MFSNNPTIIMMISIGVAILFTTIITLNADSLRAMAVFDGATGQERTSSRAPTVVTDENVYIAWWSNKTGNDEVLFRASSDGGATFGDKINLSNTINADSWRVEIDGEGDNVIVSWWETNETDDNPVARISSDAGQTFGPLLQLSQNGTLDSSSEEQE